MSARTFSFSSAEFLLRRDGSLSDQHLALLFESNPGCALPAVLNKYIVDHLRKQVKHKRGRRSRSAAALDFALIEARERVEELVPEFRKAKAVERAKPKGERKTASQLAHERVLKEMKDVFLNIDWRRLQNMISKNKRVHVDPEDDLDPESELAPLNLSR